MSTTLGQSSSSATAYFTLPPSPVLKSFTNIVDSLDAIQKVWDENDQKSTHENDPLDENSPEQNPPSAAEKAQPKHTDSDQTGTGFFEDEPDNSLDDEDPHAAWVAKIELNLRAKLRSVQKRKQLTADVLKMREKLAAMEKELDECNRVFALELEQVKPGWQSDVSPSSDDGSFASPGNNLLFVRACSPLRPSPEGYKSPASAIGAFSWSELAGPNGGLAPPHNTPQPTSTSPSGNATPESSTLENTTLDSKKWNGSATQDPSPPLQDEQHDPSGPLGPEYKKPYDSPAPLGEGESSEGGQNAEEAHQQPYFSCFLNH